MPIEIKELHIRMVVDTAAAKPAPPGQTQPISSSDAGDKDVIISECVEQVLQILKGKRER